MRDWKFGVSRYKLLYIGQINNKVLLYSTGNYTQYPAITIIKKKKRKIYMKLNHFAIHQKLTQHYQSTVLQ